MARDDKEGTGLYLLKRFCTAGAANRWVVRMAKKHFPKETHTLLRDDYSWRRWYYKEGD